jgi:hypothetical protein
VDAGPDSSVLTEQQQDALNARLSSKLLSEVALVSYLTPLLQLAWECRSLPLMIYTGPFDCSTRCH